MSSGWTTASSANGTKGWISGMACLSSDCFVSSPWAKVWHSAGCTGSMLSQLGIFAGIPLMETLAASLVIAICGHAYDATASCMNSMLMSATMAVRIRDVRVILIEIRLVIAFEAYAV